MRDYRYKREVKTTILIILIALSFVLTVRLWSVGNYFGTGLADVITEATSTITEPVLKLFRQLQGGSASQTLEYVLRPKRIAINLPDKRSVLYTGDESYSDFYKLSSDIIGKIQSGSIKIIGTETVSSEDYYASLKSKSIIVDFDNKYSFDIFSMIYGGEGQSKILKSGAIVREYILNFADNVLNHSSLFIMDYSSDTAYKYTIEIDKTELNELIDEYFLKHSSSNNPYYSFEFNFHKGENIDGTPAKVVFDPLAMIRLSEDEKKEVISTDMQTDDELIEREKELLNMFNINYLSAGKYTDIDGSKNYIEKNARLKISADGYIEYSATEGGRGIEITDKTFKKPYTLQDTVDAASEFLFEMTRLIHLPPEISLRINSDLSSSTQSGSYNICFDYYIGGFPVFQFDKSTNELKSSVVMEVENGYLKYFKQYVKDYSFGTEKNVSETMLSAADELVSKMLDELSRVAIKKVHECYVDFGEEKLQTDWVFEIDGKQGLYR